MCFSVNIAKCLREAFFIRHRGGCFCSLPLAFKIVIEKTFQLFSLLSLLRSSHSHMFFKKGVLKNFRKFSQEAPVLESLLNIAAGQKAYFTKKRPQHRQFPANIAKF